MTARGRSPGRAMGDKYGPKPRRGLGRWANLIGASQSPQQLSMLSMPFLTAAGLLLSLLGVYFGAKSLHYHLVVQKVLTAGIVDPPAGLVLDLQAHAADEMLLRQLVDECSKREDTVLYVDSSRQLVVAKHIDPTQCPLLDIMLKGKDRGVGSCTDAAVYALYAGARIIAMPQDVAAYDSLCGHQTARLFLENMYPEFVSQRKGVLHSKLVDPAYFWVSDAHLHAKMQVFLCKTQSCLEVMRQHVVDKGYWASVWMASHTSLDPRVGLSGDVVTGLRSSFNPGRPQAGYAIHVRGSSGSKQTRAVLDCWAQHPDWLPLLVVGAASDAELTPRSRAAGNIIFLPPITAAGSGGAASPSMPAVLMDATRLRDMQGAASMHVCPALQGGFVHTLNEARAVGALIVTTDHPSMNELVTPDSGLLVPTVSTDSDPGAELGALTHLNGHVSAQGLCGVVAKGLALGEAAQQAKREAAQAAYRADKAAFMHRMQQLRRFLEARVQQQRPQG